MKEMQVAKQICNVITQNDAGMRLDLYCAQAGIYRSRNAAQKAIEDGRVLVNGCISSKRNLTETGDAIVCELDEPETASPVEGYPIELDIRYEDDDMVVLSKQPFLVCHPTKDYTDPTLVSGLIYRYGPDGLCSVQGERDRLGIVHRLDADTSGLMLVAKTDIAGERLMDAIRLREVDRRYIALVHGVISVDTGMVDAPIGRDPKDRLKMKVLDCDSARDALTTFKVLKRFAASPKDNGYTLIECKLYTGRTHQIRVHAQYIKHPIVGDSTYNACTPKAVSANLGLNRQFLHSYKIGFSHPITDEYLEFEDSLPPDLQEALDSLSERVL